MQPRSADASFHLATAYLAQQKWADGWKAWSNRQLPQKDRRLAKLPVASNGLSLLGARILLQAEQGMGDIIQFSRYLVELHQLGAKIALIVDKRLHKLLTNLPVQIKLLNKTPRRLTYDFTYPLMNLPQLLQQTKAPAAQPYFAAAPRLIKTNRKHLRNGAINIGLAWQGNPDGMIDIGRSLPFSAFAPLAGLKNIHWIALQKGPALGQITPSFPITIPENFDDGRHAFVDTAALMHSLDLVITSDTSIAHLAGALGVPGVVLLKKYPDWRWQISGSKSVWYPSLTLVRQTIGGDWATCINQLTHLIQQRFPNA